MSQLLSPPDKMKFGEFTVPSQCDERDVEFMFSGSPAIMPTGMSQTLFDLYLTR
jgi:hypothetical protein